MTTRRNAVKFIAGSAVGVMFTPAPWHMIRDTALWSENWPGVPRPRRGPITTKLTHCPLCPGGCAVKARCVGEQPVSLAGVDGGLCPLGVTGHHLPYHPRRLKSGPVVEAKAAVNHALARDARPAVLDLRPGRPASVLYRQAMAERKGFYIAPPRPTVGVDLAAAKTVVSLGVPLFEGWLSPAKVFAARDKFRLIQIEPMFFRTAALADEWVPACDDVAQLAWRFALDGPVLVIDPAMSAETVALNRELGGWGKTVLPREGEAAAEIASVPDGAIEVLFIDESGPGAYLPWFEIERKLASNAVVVALTWWQDGYARHTRLALPTAVYPEGDLVKVPEWAIDPTTFITGSSAPVGDGDARPGLVSTVATPLFTKLYQESSLLLAPGQVALHPSSGFAAKERAYLATPRGRAPVEVLLDAGIPPGKMHFVPTPELIDLCGSEQPKVVRA